MKDFYNEEKNAVGICKICNKGLSKDNLIEEKNGIICKKGECKKELEKINKVIDFNSKTIEKYKKGNSNFIGALFLILMGLGFFIRGIYGYFEYDKMDYFTLFMGIIFIGISIYKYNYSKSLIKESKNK